MTKWLINSALLLTGIICVLCQFELAWTKRLLYSPVIALVALGIFVAIKIIPVINTNWTLYTLSFLAVGLAVALPLDSLSMRFCVGGLTLALGDLVHHFLDDSKPTDEDYEGWFGQGATAKFLFVPIPGFAIGTAIVAISIVTRYYFAQ